MLPIVQIGDIITERDSKIEGTILIKNKSPDLFYIVTEVGKSLGYKVPKVEKADKYTSIRISKQIPSAVGFLTGKQESTYIDITDVPEGLAMVCQTWGNYGSGTQKSAVNFFDEFKEKLLEAVSLRKEAK
jgi:hypothetical protein